MLVVRDFECKWCKSIKEVIVDSEIGEVCCEFCGGAAKKIFSIKHTTPIDEPWIGTVREIVDPHGGAHCTEFIKHPSRANYNIWKRETGLRHLEPGEKLPQPEDKKVRQARMKPQLIKKLREREALSI